MRIQNFCSFEKFHISSKIDYSLRNRYIAIRCSRCGLEITDFYKTFIIWGDHPNIENAMIRWKVKNIEENSIFKKDFHYEYRLGCPICGCRLSRKSAFFDEENDKEKFNELFASIKVEQGLVVNKEAEAKKAQEEIEKIKNVTVENQITVAKDLNANEIKQFLLHLIQTSANIDVLSKRLEELYIILGESHLKREEECLDELSRIGWEILKPSLLQENAPSFNMEKPVFSLREPQKPNEPLYRKPSIFNRKKVERENEALKNSYFARLQEYNLEFDHYQKQLDAHNKRMSEYNENLRLFNEEVAQKKAELENELNAFRENIDEKKAEISSTLAENQISNLISAEIEQIKKLLEESYSRLYSLYNCGILYGKYCNIVAVSSFYDYFMSGRCSTFDGPNGAYNLFESESRADKISFKLDVIIEELEQIKENQYTLYSKLNEINSNINKLNTTTSDMLTALRSVMENSSKLTESAEFIAYNTAMNAYYSKINAELTNSLGFLIALK